MESALLKAAAIFSTKRRLAKQIGVSPERINSWLNKDIAMPVPYAFQIQRATKFQVKWYELVSNEDKERMEHANTPLEKEMSYFIELSDVLINRIKVSTYTPTNKENFSINLERPICLDENNNLIFGLEAIENCKKQGKNKIFARRLSFVHLLKGHYGKTIENVFLVMERTSIGVELEGRLGNRQGQRTDLGKKEKKSFFKELRLNLDEVRGRTDVLIAKLLGFSSKIHYRQLKYILHYGCSQLINHVNQKTISVSKAVRLAKLPHQEQINHLHH